MHDSYCRHDEVMVRARVRADLERMIGRTSQLQGERLKLVDAIVEIRHADYRYRFKMKRVDWAMYVGLEAHAIDYPSVKDSIRPDESWSRKNAMYRCWSSMAQMQDEADGR